MGKSHDRCVDRCYETTETATPGQVACLNSCDELEEGFVAATDKEQELRRRLGRFANPVFFEIESAGFSIIETSRLGRLMGDAGRWRKYCVTGTAPDDETQLASLDDLREPQSLFRGQ